VIGKAIASISSATYRLIDEQWMKSDRSCKESVDAIASFISCCKTISLALAKLI
jgi:hypothetical protein